MNLSNFFLSVFFNLYNHRMLKLVLRPLSDGTLNVRKPCLEKREPLGVSDVIFNLFLHMF